MGAFGSDRKNDCEKNDGQKDIQQNLGLDKVFQEGRQANRQQNRNQQNKKPLFRKRLHKGLIGSMRHDWMHPDGCKEPALSLHYNYKYTNISNKRKQFPLDQTSLSSWRILSLRSSITSSGV
jgi:hypothetical protein